MSTASAVILATLVCSLPVLAEEAGAREAPRNTLEQVFAPGGRVKMDLGAGGYKLRGASTDGKIHVRWHADDADEVRVSLDVKGTEARLRTRGPHHHFEVEIDLPSRTDLKVSLSAGELDIRGLEGDKDLRCHAGDIKVVVGSFADYRHADASVKVGDLQGFGETHSGFFRSLEWSGPGKYELHATLGAGELRIVKEASK